MGSVDSRTTDRQETKADSSREWPCVRFSRTDVSNPQEVAKFIAWLCGFDRSVGDDDFTDPEGLIEVGWSWRGAPRKRMAKLCWQMLVRNRSEAYFDQYFTYDLVWLERQVADRVGSLAPIRKKLVRVLEGFRQRRQEDAFLGQGSWGEEWFLPPRPAAYVRKQLRRTRPDLIEEASNYEDALHYYSLPYYELASNDNGRVYVGEHQREGGTHVWVEDIDGARYPLNQAQFPFRQTPGSGFAWGYGGGGPSALSLSVLADAVGGDLEVAERFRIPFIEEIIGKISWNGNLRLARERVLGWLREHGVNEQQLTKAEMRVEEIKGKLKSQVVEHKERLKKIREMGGLRMQRFDIVPADFEAALYVDLMNMFDRASWVLHCSRCQQPMACDRSPRGNRQRARWLAGRPVYHESCFGEHRRNQKRAYWAQRTKEPRFRISERERGRRRRRR
jgi:hypothetical protein